MAKSVVLVEDDPLLRGVLSSLIQDLGAICSAFATSDDALIHLLRADSPSDMVIADQATPGQLQGSDLASLIRQRWPACPVVIMSGHEAASLGDLPSGIPFIQKPLSIDSLFDLVSSTLFV